MSSTETVIGFVGGGNMASAMMKGLLSNGYPAEKILVAETSKEKSAELSKCLGVRVTDNLNTLVVQSETIILAVKPQVIDTVTQDIASSGKHVGKLFISVAAGVKTIQIASILGEDTAVVRLMPNMPALIGQGMSGLYANSHTSTPQKRKSLMIAESFGDCVEVTDENDINTITALSGSGPAYFFLMFENMVQAGIELGLSEQSAHKLACFTALGSAKMAQGSSFKPAELRQQVTSKGGTTESAINYFEQNGFPSIVRGAVKAAYSRSVELSQS
ncbi:pyrroline-5-carboxylate reductase [Neptunomonas marina]|uniref:Pyrroline-5-carboxylate reductase n=1 Tax=Neptunomonas marina TaxID=1815562 RepID=A0A437Q8X3_9GAMM|nr:pyrroline-5-carboxylate reductase [Neptunomonas marina]RVU31031.1 pyrroline-5-carboxylate reductase [Neptunomonas marina]